MWATAQQSGPHKRRRDEGEAMPKQRVQNHHTEPRSNQRGFKTDTHIQLELLRFD